MGSVVVVDQAAPVVVAARAEERIHALDALRAGAMFLGIVLHAAIVLAVAIPMPGVGSDVSTHWTFDMQLLLIHGFRMQLFFFLSGFFGRLLHERLGTREFVKQRLRRIGIPFALGMVTLMPLVVLLAMWALARKREAVSFPEGVRTGIPTMHLWFLWYLLLLYGVALAVRRVFLGRLFSVADRVFDAVMGSMWRVVAFVPLAVVFLWGGPWWGEARVPFLRMTPEWATLGHYGVFFAVGWWLHRRRERLADLKRFITPSFLIALAAHGALQWLELLHEPDSKLAAVFCAGTYAWGMTFALTGWFLKFANVRSEGMRYLADASYWCYLAHLPVLLLIQVLTAGWPWPAYVKFLFSLTVTMGLLMGWYHWRVRHTWVGRMLNGPRERSGRRFEGAFPTA